MSASQRNKGARGQSEAAKLLVAMGWTVDPITSGIRREDMIATDPDGIKWSVEVKNCASIIPAHKRQAMAQAAARKMPWLLMHKLPGTRSWLVQGRGLDPTIMGC